MTRFILAASLAAVASGALALGGVPTEVVVAAGKMGRVYAFEAANGQPIWQRAVGLHQNDVGLLTRRPEVVLPGELGGVETPMAYDGSSLYVPVVNLAFRYSSTVVKPASRAGLFGGTGELVALNPANGSVRWRQRFATADYGAATVSNDVVFTATFNGRSTRSTLKREPGSGRRRPLPASTGSRQWTATPCSSGPPLRDRT